MNRARTAALVSMALVALFGCHARERPKETPATSPVQDEMRQLTSALERAVRGIGRGDVRDVEHDLHRVHETKEATEAALRDGRYRPPKNGDRLEAFEARDTAFHHDLERLEEASHANDLPGAAEALGAVMRRCPGCHAAYRP